MQEVVLEQKLKVGEKTVNLNVTSPLLTFIPTTKPRREAGDYPVF